MEELMLIKQANQKNLIFDTIDIYKSGDYCGIISRISKSETIDSIEKSGTL